MPFTRRSHNYSPHKRTRIVTIYNKGMKAKAIGAEFSLSPGAIYAIVRRYRSQASARELPRSGRPLILDERYKRHIFRLIT